MLERGPNGKKGAFIHGIGWINYPGMSWGDVLNSVMEGLLESAFVIYPLFLLFLIIYMGIQLLTML